MMTRGRSVLTNHHADEQQKCSVLVIPGWYDAVYLVPQVCTQSSRVECGPLHNLTDGCPGPGAMAQINIYMPLWRGSLGGSWNAVTCCSVSNPEQHKPFSRSRRSSVQRTVAQIASRRSVLFLELLSANSWVIGGLLRSVFQKKLLRVQTEDYHNRQLWCKTTSRCKKEQPSHYKSGQALRVLGGWRSQILRHSTHDDVRLSAVCTGHLFPPQEISLVLIFVRSWVEPRATVQPERLSQLKIPVTPSGIEHATFRLVAQCLDRLRQWMPRKTRENLNFQTR